MFWKNLSAPPSDRYQCFQGTCRLHLQIGTNDLRNLSAHLQIGKNVLEEPVGSTFRYVPMIWRNLLAPPSDRYQCFGGTCRVHLQISTNVLEEPTGSTFRLLAPTTWCYISEDSIFLPPWQHQSHKTSVSTYKGLYANETGGYSTLFVMVPTLKQRRLKKKLGKSLIISLWSSQIWQI
jgi:hypothetical protein